MNDYEKVTIEIPLGAILRYGIVFLVAAILFIAGRFVFATTPNPGHPWTDLGNGTWQVANTQTALRTFTFPDSDETVLTTAGAPTSGTVIYGSGSGVLSTTSAGTAGQVLALLNGVPTWTATTTLANISGTLGLASGGTNASLAASNGGIVYSSATQLQILGGTATANKLLVSGASGAPSWSTPTFPNASATARKIIVSDGTNWIASTETYAVPGAVPNKLASDGTNWIAASGRIIIGRQVKVNGNTTYVPTAGTNAVLIQMCAGGGGGGGATGATTPTASVGGGGGSGGYLEKFVTFSTTAASYTIAVGAAGTSGSASNGAGGSGGSTTFACDANCSSGAITFTANGGSGAPAANTAGTSVLASLGGAGGTVSTNGDVNETGQPGQPAQRFSGSTGISGNGAPSHFGGGGNSVNAVSAVATAGNAAGGNCAGGGGAISAGSASGVTGGAGGAGVMIIWELR
jgi:hypothetical protein